MLQTEQNTKKVERLVVIAARQRFGRRLVVKPFFEHGQWWITVLEYNGPMEDANFSVVDAAPGISAPGIGDTGLDFEEV